MPRHRPNAKRPPNAPAWLLETHTLGSDPFFSVSKGPPSGHASPGRASGGTTETFIPVNVERQLTYHEAMGSTGPRADELSNWYLLVADDPNDRRLWAWNARHGDVTDLWSADHFQEIAWMGELSQRHRHRRNGFELSEQEQAELTEQEQGLYNEIVNAEFSEYNYDELVKAIERFEYTTTALAALAAWYSELGDSDASMMILAFADEFAKYEAKTI